MDADTLNPFMPGAGGTPPYLAGREIEQGALKGQLTYLAHKRSPQHELVLIGPRGNGKTALLRWFEREIGRNKKVDTVWLTPNKIKDLDQLAQELAPAARFGAFLPDDVTLHLGVSRLDWKLEGSSGSLTRLVAARCAEKPLVILLDEAQNLDKGVGSDLLNTSQEVRTQAPFLLVMAGTPVLEARLNAMSATFWDRARILGIGRLAANKAAAAALRLPLIKAGFTVDESALTQVVESSQRYPYFIQLWGAALWDAVQAAPTQVVDETLVHHAAKDFLEGKNTYYARRYRELEQVGLSAGAARVAAAFATGSTLSTATVKAALNVADNTDVQGALDTLHALGYIWRPPDEVTWEAGLPSLMDYVREVS